MMRIIARFFLRIRIRRIVVGRIIRGVVVGLVLGTVRGFIFGRSILVGGEPIGQTITALKMTPIPLIALAVAACRQAIALVVSKPVRAVFWEDVFNGGHRWYVAGDPLAGWLATENEEEKNDGRRVQKSTHSESP